MGSVREGRFNDIPTAWIAAHLKKQTGVEVEVLDLKDYPMPFFYEPVSPSHREGEPSNPVAVAWAKKIAEADGFVVVTPEYNHGYPAVLKNAIDWLGKEWKNKVMGFVAYGGAGGARSVEQLRMVAIELQVVPMRNAIHLFGSVMAAAAKDPAALNESDKAAQTFIEQLVTLTRALKTVRSNN